MLFLYSNIIADSKIPIDVRINSIFHAESQTLLGKENNSSFPQESSGFSSWYNHLFLDYDINDDFYLSLAGKTNLELGNSPYKTPEYLRFVYSSDNINQAIVSEASLNYDNGLVSLNAGRIEVNYDWLSGSMDGAIAMIGDEKSYSFRLFYLENYLDLRYNYYVDFKDVNEELNFYGAIATMNTKYLEATLYTYQMPRLRNISGLHAYVALEKVGFNFASTFSTALQDALYQYDEQFFEASIEGLYKNNFFEMGGSVSGENGLITMLQMGSFLFGQFYLGNQVERQNAKNGYMRYIYAKNRFRFELLAGATLYDYDYNTVFDDLNAQELDVFLGYKFNKVFQLEAGIMFMNVDELDPLSVDQVLINSNLIIHYDNYD